MPRRELRHGKPASWCACSRKPITLTTVRQAWPFAKLARGVRVNLLTFQDILRGGFMKRLFRLTIPRVLIATLLLSAFAGTSLRSQIERRAMTSESDFRQAMDELSNWGRWGPEDACKMPPQGVGSLSRPGKPIPGNSIFRPLLDGSQILTFSSQPQLLSLILAKLPHPKCLYGPWDDIRCSPRSEI